MCHIRDTTRTPDFCLPSLERCGVSEGGAWHKGSGIGSASRSRTSHALSARRPGSCAAHTRVPEHPSTEERGASSVVAYLFLGFPFPPPAPLALFYRDFLQCMRCAADMVVTVAAATYRAPG